MSGQPTSLNTDESTVQEAVIGIDASRTRSGGGKAHLVGILSNADPREFGISKVHVWAYQSLLDELPVSDWLVKHCPPALEDSLARQLWWQFRALPIELRVHGCDLLLSVDAGTVCPFRPSVVISQDMLSYEPGEMRRYGFSRMRARLIALRYVQASSIKRAAGVIFLSRHAARAIQKVTGALSRITVIPHGVGLPFRSADIRTRGLGVPSATVSCIYVSQADLYKHQWNVVRAIGQLRARAYDVSLLLVGGGEGHPQRKLEAELAKSDPAGDFVTVAGFVPHSELPALLADADLFVFASSCENMPNTLVEGMASGLPIACSDRGPMPEVLRDGGVYFDPEDSASIASAIERLLLDAELRSSVASRAEALSREYSWGRCADETWAFLRDTVEATRISGTK